MMALDPSAESSPRRRTRRISPASWIWIGLAFSAPIHMLVVAILSSASGGVGGRVGGGETTVEISIVDAEPLKPFAAPAGGGGVPSPELRAAEPEIESDELGGLGSLESSGASRSGSFAISEGAESLLAAGGGGGGGSGGDGMGSGTSFFGVGGRGRRVGYVVDKSGSMGVEDRMLLAKAEIIRSIGELPDYASVCVVLFDESFTTFDKEGGFVKCRDEQVSNMKSWIRSILQGGGTDPVPAFEFLLSRRERPDMVFFMSDGEIPPDAADEILRLNRRGPNTVIHCLAFGRDAGLAPLRRIASETGGTFSVVGQGMTP